MTDILEVIAKLSYEQKGTDEVINKLKEVGVHLEKVNSLLDELSNKSVNIQINVETDESTKAKG